MSTATMSRNLLVREPLSPQVVEIGVRRARNETQYAENASALGRGDDYLLNARQVAERLGVSERWVRDHTTRRTPKIRGVKLGTLMRYRRADVEIFMQELDTFPTSRRFRNGV